MSASKKLSLPALPLDEWEAAKTTLHQYCQIIGKTRLALMPRRNHWWNATLYVSTRGLATGPMPTGNGSQRIEAQLDFIDHECRILDNAGGMRRIPLRNGVSVAAFYQQFMAALAELEVEPAIKPQPYDMGVETPFPENDADAAYDPEYVTRYWHILSWVDDVFKEFAGRFYGKTCPVHLYWHSFDLAVTRFSGKKGPAPDPNARISDKDAYTHECISFGFWPGDANTRSPAFYSYTFPAPSGLDSEPLQPEAATWLEQNGSPLAVLMYDSVRACENPRDMLLAFLESAYQAGAARAAWPAADLAVPPLDAL